MIQELSRPTGAGEGLLELVYLASGGALHTGVFCGIHR